MEFTEAEKRDKSIENPDGASDAIGWNFCKIGDKEYQVGSQICIEGRLMECSIQGMWFPTGDLC